MAEYRVYGPPGTGNTAYVARQLAAAEASGREPFVASFTRAAAAEIADRADLPKERVGTLHALCHRALGQPTIAETKVREFSDYALTPHSAHALDEADGPAALADGDALLGEYNVLRARLISHEQMPAPVRAFAARWAAWKHESGYLDFTDLLEAAIADGIEPPGRVAFFDEAQDFTPLDFALARQWGADYLDDVVFVGDEDQVIYEWRGASPLGLLEPELPAEAVRVLGQSYRLPATVHAYALAWIANVERRADKPFAPRAEAGEVIRAPHLRDAAAIADMLEAAPVSETTLALATCSYMLHDITAELMRRGALIHHPWRREHPGWNPLGKAAGGGTGARVLRMLADNPAVHGEHARPWTYGDIAAFLVLMRKTGVTRRGMAITITKYAQDREASYASLTTIFENGVIDALHAAPIEFLAAHATKARARPIAYLEAVIKRHGLGALAAPEPRITVGTIHSLKGGEADHVIVLPDLSQAGAASRESSRAGWDAATRLFYVAMTRARVSLMLAGARSRRSVAWPHPASTTSATTASSSTTSTRNRVIGSPANATPIVHRILW